MPLASADDWEVISPELVLVSDPEAARRARAELPDPLSWRLSAAMRLRAAAAAPIAEPAPVQPRPRRRSLRYVAGAVALAILGYGVAAFVMGGSAQVIPPAADAAQAPKRTTATSLPSDVTSSTTAQARTQTSAVVPASVPEAAPTTVAPTRVAATTTAPPPPTATAHTHTPTQPARPVGFVPARTWTWASVAGAHAYVVTFYRNGQQVFRARVESTSLQLPHRFAFEAGRYRWNVHAEGSTRHIVESSFVLNAAQAAAANASTR